MLGALPRPALCGERVGVRGSIRDRGLSIDLYPLTRIASAMRSDLSPQAGRGKKPQVSIFTYSKSPGLLSMPTFGGDIQDAYWPVSVLGVIRQVMKSQSADYGTHSALRLFQVVQYI